MTCHFLVDYKDCGSSDEGDSKSDTKENSSATGSESDDADSSDVDFFGLSSKPEVRHIISQLDKQ